MKKIPAIGTDSLRKMLSAGEPVNIIDVRPLPEKSEWFIPGSIYLDVYDRLKRRDNTAMDGLYLDRSVPVVTVCAAGNTSQIAADLLRNKGYNAYSLENGMKGWSLAWNMAHEDFGNFEVWQVRRTGKGCLSYVIASNKEAVVIDASLPMEVYTELIADKGIKVKYVIETHIHADHLSRSRDLAHYLQVPLYLPVPNQVQFAFEPIDGGTVFTIGAITLQCLPTPGHTLESFSFYIDKTILVTGDTLFTNGVGRPDLKSTDEETREKSRLLYLSLKHLLSLPDNTIVLPAHSNKPVAFDNKLIKTTIGEAKKNILLLRSSEPDFIEFLLKNIPAAPPNYLSIVEKNKIGHYEDVDPIELEAGANRCAIS